MKSFFDRICYCCNVALAVLLVSGCTSFPVSSGNDEASSSSAEASMSADRLANDLSASRAEEARLRKQLEEHAHFQKLIDDLARYPGLSTEEMRGTQAELSNNISAGHGYVNENRIRLAHLLSLQPGGVNDQRAISLLDTVTKSEKATVSLRHLASILRVQVHEKQQTLKKLEELREVDRRLLNERITGGKTSPPKTTSKKAPPKAAPKQP